VTMAQAVAGESGSAGVFRRVRVPKVTLMLVAGEAELVGARVVDVWAAIVSSQSALAGVERAREERRGRPVFAGRWPEDG
jgi:hypothetical protein